MPAQKHAVLLHISMQIEGMALKNNVPAYLLTSILAIHRVYLMPGERKYVFLTCKCYFTNKTRSLQSLIAFCLYQSWKDNQGNHRIIIFFLKVSTKVFKCLWSNSAVIARVINENIYKLWRRQTSGWEERLGNKSTTLRQGAIWRKLTRGGNQQLTPEQDDYSRRHGNVSEKGAAKTWR